MNVHGVGYAGTQGVFTGKVVEANGSPREDQGNQSRKSAIGELTDTNVSAGGPAAGPVDDGGSGTEASKGVLRLLQEGHFRGVADVRLRINFHEELTAAQSQAIKSGAAEPLATLPESVSSWMDGLLESGELAEDVASGVAELQEAFNARANELAGQFLRGAGLVESDLISGLRASFDVLVESLRSLLGGGQTGPQEPVDQMVPVGDGELGVVAAETGGETGAAEDETSPSSATLNPGESLDELIDLFNTALEQLSSALTTTRLLPPLSEPNGNGVAYEKFLAIYNELHGGQQGGDADQDEEPLDTVA